MKQYLYIDVTQLVHWQGHVAGIPRVMYELSKRFVSTDNTEVVYVSWVKELQAFCVIDFEATMRRQGVVYLRNRSNQPQASPAPRALPLHGLRRFGKRAIKKAFRTLHLSNVSVVRRLQADVVAAEMSTYQQIVFGQGDSIFVPWGEWWDENFLLCLEEGVATQGLKIIPIIHDVLPFTQGPQFSGHSTESLRNYCRRIVPKSALVLCVSKSTRNDLTEWMKVNELPVPKMEVFRLGEDFEFAAAEPPTEKAFVESGLKGNDYTITVGTIEARKNHALLYYVHKLAKQRGIELPTAVVVGRRGWKTEQIYDIMTQDPEVKDKFVFLHDASDENLSWLYDHALISVYPSFLEGWGMPIAESVARGVPCACSNTTSMVEVAEGYVEHFSPASTDECLNVIKDMLLPENLKRLREKCANYKQTTWNESYKQVEGFIREVANV